MNHKTRHGGGCQPKHQLHCNSSPAIMKKLLSKIGGSRKASNTAQEPLSTSQANATFGATTDGFGSSTSSSEFGSTPRTGTFGSAMADFGATTGGFGSSTTSSEFGYTPSTGTFGSAMTEFGQQGTTIKFQPVTGSDTMMKSGVLLNVSTRHQCILFMEEYNTFTLEELRCADYMANRKGLENGRTAPGNTSATGLFGESPNQTALGTGGLFGANISQVNASFGETTGSFGSSTTAFGFGSTQSTGSFGGAMANFGQQQQQVNGTTVKFQPVTGSDTMMKSGVHLNVSTRHQCISCMSEYNTFTLEELRWADYMANRKGPGNGWTAPTNTGLFVAKPIVKEPIPNKDQNLQIDRQSPQLPSGSECSTCYEPRTRTFALLPCGHATFCEKCATYFSESSDKRCPTCRAKTTGKVRLFL